MTTTRPIQLTQVQKKAAVRAIKARFSRLQDEAQKLQQPAPIKEVHAPYMYNHEHYSSPDKYQDVSSEILQLYRKAAKLHKKFVEAHQVLIEACTEHNDETSDARFEWQNKKRDLIQRLTKAEEEAVLTTEMNGAPQELLEFLQAVVPDVPGLTLMAKELGIELDSSDLNKLLASDSV